MKETNRDFVGEGPVGTIRSCTREMAMPPVTQTLSPPSVRAPRIAWPLFVASFLVYAFLGWVGAYLLETYNWDGITRIAQAHGVLFSRDPHLAALGFVWPPLPALSDLPLLFLLKPLGLPLLSGPLMSAFYAAFALVQIDVILHRFGLSLPWRLVWVTAFGMHQLIVHNSVMGLSEAPFMALLLLSLNGFLQWEQDGRPGGLLWAGIGAALAIYCRYEALAWVAAMAFAIAWRQWVVTGKLWSHTASGSIVAFITPPVWALALWVFANWQITGNPIYFLVGPGSTATTPDTAHIVGPTHLFYYAQGSLAGSALLLARQILSLAPLVLPASIALLLVAIWRRRWADLTLLFVAWSILAFTFLIALRGLLPPWSRYFFWMVPAGVVVAAATYRACPHGWPRGVAALAAAGLLLVPAVGLPAQAWGVIQQPMPQRLFASLLVAPETAQYAGEGGQLDEFVEMARFLNGQPQGTTTMIDASVGSGIVFFLDRPQDLVLTTDKDFFSILHQPVGQVEQILVPFPSFDARGRSEVLKAYPTLYDEGAPWAQLVREFPGPGAWRLFRVVEPR